MKSMSQQVKAVLVAKGALTQYEAGGCYVMADQCISMFKALAHLALRLNGR